MVKYNVKLFEERSIKIMQYKMNRWLDENPDIKIIDQELSSHDCLDVIMILYEVE